MHKQECNFIWQWGEVEILLVNLFNIFFFNLNLAQKSATELYLMFDRWVDNGERVGDFLWAANEPSGGTFQVKRNLFSRVCLQNIWKGFHICDPSFQWVVLELPDAGRQLAVHGSRFLLLAKVKINIVNKSWGQIFRINIVDLKSCR